MTNLTMQTYERIRSDILTRRLAPGQKLKISKVCEQLEVSLGAVREALSRLSSEGFVESEPNRGFRVTPISQVELKDLTQTRVIIECECLSSAIAHGDVKWETGIVATLFELSRTELTDSTHAARVNPAWAETHRRFHEALVAACDSPWLLRLRDILYVQSERYRTASVSLDRKKRDVAREHQAIADAAIARDTEAALAAMRDHLRLTMRILVEADVMNRASGD